MVSGGTLENLVICRHESDFGECHYWWGFASPSSDPCACLVAMLMRLTTFTKPGCGSAPFPISAVSMLPRQLLFTTLELPFLLTSKSFNQ